MMGFLTAVTAVEPDLGLTISALMLFISGAIGAWARAVISGTQTSWGQRTIVDCLIGGGVGIILPIVAPILNRVLGIDYYTWTTLQQSVLSFLIGGGGTWLWTAIGWRRGLIVTPEEQSTGIKPDPPQQGVLKGTKEAKEAAGKYEADTAASNKDETSSP